jgi:hypothetical protein
MAPATYVRTRGGPLEVVVHAVDEEVVHAAVLAATPDRFDALESDEEEDGHEDEGAHEADDERGADRRRRRLVALARAKVLATTS